MVQILTLYWTMDPDPGSTIYTQWPSPSPRRCFSLFLPHFTKMAYSRRSRFRRRRYPARRYARRSFRPTRFARRRRRTNRMSTRRVRNIASRKCRDNMLSTPRNDAGDVQPAAPYQMTGDTSYRFCSPHLSDPWGHCCPRRTPDFCELYGALEV